MLFYPNAKINLGLNILDKRSDGYHNLETVFYPIPLSDILEVVPFKGSDFGHCEINQTGIQFDGNPQDNICFKAYQILHKDFNLPSVKIHLHKQIPVGAGLGGGSSDAAFTIKALNEIFNLDLAIEQMEAYGSKLGADCAFFIENKAKFASGIGDEFKPTSIDLSGKFLVLICPDIHSSTAEAYSGVEFSGSQQLQKAILSPVEKWKHIVSNDFESSLFPLYPRLEELKLELYAKGASFTSMSGSGSSIFGIFNEKPNCYFELGGIDYHVFQL